MPDPYLYPDVPVLRNKLDIKTEKTLDLVEAEQSRANMMLLYDAPFSDFTPKGLRHIHEYLFGDIYDWAGEYRIINIQKAERLLGGRSVWYSNDDDIERDLAVAFQAMPLCAAPWETLRARPLAATNDTRSLSRKTPTQRASTCLNPPLICSVTPQC